MADHLVQAIKHVIVLSNACEYTISHSYKNAISLQKALTVKFIIWLARHLGK